MSNFTSVTGTPTLGGSAHHLDHQSIVEQSNEPNEHHVDIARAEEAFHELERQLSRISTSKQSKRTSTDKHYDIEKAELGPEEQPFDLREYLASSNDENQRHGIKHKHVGVTWKDLEVKVIGGSDHKVQ